MFARILAMCMASRGNAPHIPISISLLIALKPRSKTREAAVMYRVVTMLKHEDFQAHINAGNSMLALGRSKEAFAEYDRVVNHGESLPDADHIQVSVGPRSLNSTRRACQTVSTYRSTRD